MSKFVCSEFIGKDVEITESENKSNIGLKGKIIDETKNIIIIKNQNKIKKINKNQNKINFVNENITINGKEIIGRPEERIK